MDGNPKTQYGLAKPSLSKVPPLPLLAIGQVMMNGAHKYGPHNDPETGLPHLAHAAANLCILMDADSGPWLQDDRPIAGYTNEFISDNTKKANTHGD